MSDRSKGDSRDSLSHGAVPGREVRGTKPRQAPPPVKAPPAPPGTTGQKKGS